MTTPHSVHTPETSQTGDTAPEWRKDLNAIIDTVELENANQPWHEQSTPAERSVEKKRRLNDAFATKWAELATQPDDYSGDLIDQLEYIGELLDRYKDIDESTVANEKLESIKNNAEMSFSSEAAQRMIASFRDKNNPSED